MKLSECKIGEVVGKGLVEDPIIGHIVGLTVNPASEVVPLVKWATDKDAFPQHHKNIFLLKD